MRIKDYIFILGMGACIGVVCYEIGKSKGCAIEEDIRIYKQALDIYEIANKALSRELEELEKRG